MLAGNQPEEGPMYTVVYAIYPKDGMSAEDFRHHLTDVHSAIGRRLPGVRRYEQFPVRSADGELGPEVGAFAVVQFDSEEAYEQAAASSVMQEAGEDAANYARHFSSYVVDVNSLL
jgi:uncharacterized protein (TIGR02118 family)